MALAHEGGVTSGHLADSLGLHLAYVGPTATAYSVRMATKWCATSGTWLGGNANAPLVGGPHTYRDVRNIKKMRIVPSCLRTYVRTYLRLAPTAGVLAQAGKGCGSWLDTSWHIPMMYGAGLGCKPPGDLDQTNVHGPCVP